MGIAVFAVSYDAVDVLAAFAARHGVTYPLLSDEGSAVIRRLGLENTQIAEQSAVYGVTVHDYFYGTPYPGLFVLDREGTIVDRRFEQSYRVRPTPSLLLADLVGDMDAEPLPRPAVVQAERPGLRITAWTDLPTYRPWQKFLLHVGLHIAPGCHVYGAPVPDDYTPLSIAVTALQDLGGDLAVDAAQLPAARPLPITDLNERLHGYEGTLRARVPVVITGTHGAVGLAVQVRYQVCSDNECFPPDEVTLEVPLEGLDMVRG